jgi:hypothetical protein
LPTIKLNDNKIEVVPIVSKPPPTSSSPMKCMVEGDRVLSSYIARLEHLEDLEKIGTLLTIIMKLVVVLLKFILMGSILTYLLCLR